MRAIGGAGANASCQHTRCGSPRTKQCERSHVWSFIGAALTFVLPEARCGLGNGGICREMCRGSSPLLSKALEAARTMTASTQNLACFLCDQGCLAVDLQRCARRAHARAKDRVHSIRTPTPKSKHVELHERHIRAIHSSVAASRGYAGGKQNRRTLWARFHRDPHCQADSTSCDLSIVTRDARRHAREHVRCSRTAWRCVDSLRGGRTATAYIEPQ